MHVCVWLCAACMCIWLGIGGGGRPRARLWCCMRQDQHQCRLLLPHHSIDLFMSQVGMSSSRWYSLLHGNLDGSRHMLYCHACLLLLRRRVRGELDWTCRTCPLVDVCNCTDTQSPRLKCNAPLKQKFMQRGECVCPSCLRFSRSSQAVSSFY